MSENVSPNITINSNSGSNKSGSFTDNLFNNLLKWGLFLVVIIAIITIATVVYFVFFSETASDAFDAIPISLIANAIIPFGIGGGLARLFGLR